MVYIGSRNDNLTSIPKRKLKNEECIYAYEDEVFALLEIFRGNGDLDFKKGIDKNSKPFIVERRKGLLEEVYNNEGYIYELSDENFHHEPGIWDAQVISYEEEPIKKKRKINNIYEELKKSNITIYEYPNRPEWMPLDNSDLINTYIDYYNQGMTNALNDLIRVYPEFETIVNDKLEKMEKSKIKRGIHDESFDGFYYLYEDYDRYIVGSQRIVGNLYTIYSNKDFYFPYLLFIPKNMTNNSELVLYNNTPRSFNLPFNELINRTINENKRSLDPIIERICINYGYPIMIPILPRVHGFNTIHLGREVYTNDTSIIRKDIQNGNSKLSMEDVDKFKNIPEQLYLMAQNALLFLRLLGYQLSDKIIVSGYSSGSKTTNMFTALYPNIVDMEICGGTGGLSIIPLKEFNGTEINYPIGVNDIPNFDLEAYSKVKHFFYIGDEDYNDPAMCKCETVPNMTDPNGNEVPKRDDDGSVIPIYDNDGMLLPKFTGMYNKDNINAIASLYGIRDGFDNQRRFDLNTQIYHELGINSVHKKYPGNHRTVFDNLDQIMNDINQLIIEKNKTLK